MNENIQLNDHNKQEYPPLCTTESLTYHKYCNMYKIFIFSNIGNSF